MFATSNTSFRQKEDINRVKVNLHGHIKRNWHLVISNVIFLTHSCLLINEVWWCTHHTSIHTSMLHFFSMYADYPNRNTEVKTHPQQIVVLIPFALEEARSWRDLHSSPKSLKRKQSACIGKKFHKSIFKSWIIENNVLYHQLQGLSDTWLMGLILVNILDWEVNTFPLRIIWNHYDYTH